jgi:hypothetical protein
MMAGSNAGKSTVLEVALDHELTRLGMSRSAPREAPGSVLCREQFVQQMDGGARRDPPSFGECGLPALF